MIHLNLDSTTFQISANVLEWANKDRYSNNILAKRMREYYLNMDCNKNTIIHRLCTSFFGPDILLASVWLSGDGFGDFSLKDLGRIISVDISNEDYFLAFKKH